MMRDEQYETRHIPANFESGITIGGMSFRIRFLLEGGFLSILCASLTFLYLSSVKIGDKATVIGISLAIGALFLIFGLKGLNDEPISKFILNLIRFKKDKKVAYYNPRIKTEAKPFISEEDIPMEENRITAAIEKIKALIKDNSAKKVQAKAEDETADEIIVFEDDLKLEEDTRQRKGRKLHVKKQGK